MKIFIEQKLYSKISTKRKIYILFSAFGDSNGFNIFYGIKFGTLRSYYFNVADSEEIHPRLENYYL